MQKIKMGDMEEQDRFLNANVRLIVSRVKKFCPLGDARANDLVNEGALGLIRAIKDFEPGKKFKFSTYAVWWIDAHIRKGLKFFKKETVAAPNTMKKKYETAVKVLYASTGETPEPEEVAKYLRWTPEDLRTFQKVGGNQKVIVRGVNEALPCNNANPTKRAERQELSEKIAGVLNRLTPAEEDIIRRRYGIGTEEETLVQIATFYGLAKERIRQIENHALRKLFVFLRERAIIEEKERAEE
jgi:RNA polymerase primary sigma factor